MDENTLENMTETQKPAHQAKHMSPIAQTDEVVEQSAKPLEDEFRFDPLEEDDPFDIGLFKPLDIVDEEPEPVVTHDKPKDSERKAWHLKDQPSHAPKLLKALCAVAIAAVFVGIAALGQSIAGRATGGSAQNAVNATQDNQSAAESASTPASATTAQPAAESEPHVEPRKTAYELQGDTAQMIKASNTYGILTQAIGEFEDKGYELAFVLHDCNSGHELTYNANTELYPASSMKGPYTTSVYEMLVENGAISMDTIYTVAEDTIHSSSDESYRRLIEICGRNCFADWLEDSGISPGSYETYGEMVDWNYPWVSATQLNQMWQRIYTYLSTTDSEARQQLDEFLRDRDTSPMRDAIGEKYETRGKAGWIDSEGDYRATPATVDSGIVYAGKNPYVVTVISTAPADLESLSTLFAPLDRAHDDMVKGFAL
ncbi:MAG: hypothetical protein Q4B54_09410 [Coriobacteriales bacterium]|nr:hypothetical protein [Coriobacteriales bacterium]